MALLAGTRFLTAAAVIVLLATQLPATQTVDRLVAVVGTEPIFLSDVREVVRLQLLDPGGSLAPFAADAGTVPEQQALARMIDRRLVLAEAARYSQAALAAADIETAQRAWTAKFPQPPPHDPAVVRAFLSDSLRIERYIDQRFTAASQPTREEARLFHQANPASFPQPFETMEDEARRRLAEERRVTMVREWLRGLRERGQVRIL
jgi:hypothetical protein